MARSSIVSQGQDPVTDQGSVLFSLIMGEQLEFPVDLSFYPDATQLVFEPVVMEADNVPGQTSAPSALKAGGANATLQTRLPVYQGAYVQGNAYSRGDMVLLGGSYWELTAGYNYRSALGPVQDPMWRASGLSRVYVRFPSNLGSNWQQKPAPSSSVYGFFELACSESLVTSFPYTWKPVRGVVELQFSPTQLV